MPQEAASKYWCFTINNPSTKCAGWAPEQMQYLLCGYEKGEKNTVHIQGYVQFKKRIRLAQAKSFFPRAHLEKTRGSPQDNYAYCTKDGESHDHGVMLKGKGARNDLNDIKGLIDSGRGIEEIRESHYATYIRYRRSILEDLQHSIKDRTRKTKLYVLYGPTGVGKSRYCAESYPNAYWKPYGQWWDGYEQQDAVVIDDFYGWLPFAFLLRLCDRYPLRVEVKGGTRKFTSSVIIITSNHPVSEWFPNVSDDRLRAALSRRIDGICEYDGGEVEFKSPEEV